MAISATSFFLIKRKIKNITIIGARARARRKNYFLFWGDKTRGTGVARARHVRLTCKVALQHVRKRHNFLEKLCAHFALNYTQLQFAPETNVGSKAIISRKITRNFTENPPFPCRSVFAVVNK